MPSHVPLQIGYLVPEEQASEEDTAALAWLHDKADLVPHHLTETPLPDTLDVLWVHRPERVEWTEYPDFCNVLRGFVGRGGRLLLTGFAALLPHLLGLEPQRPEVRTRSIEDKGFGRGCGFQSFRGHPLFDGFHGGAFVWFGDEDHTAERVGYFDTAWPGAGRVVGIEKGYITLYQDSRLVVEHRVGVGRLLSVGAFIHFAAKNHLALHTRHFIKNALFYLANEDRTGHTTYWEQDDNVPRPIAILAVKPLVLRPPPSALRTQLPNLTLTRDTANDAFFDVAGRRCMMMGTERGGLDEVWVHPFRVLQNFEAGIVKGGGVRWLSEIPTRIEVRPEALVRRYRLPTGTLTETVYAAPEAPGGLVRFIAEGAGPLVLIVRFRSDFRWMWPYAENTLGSLHFGYDESLHALHLHDRSGDFDALLGSDQPPDDHLEGAFDHIDCESGVFHSTPSESNQVIQALRFTLDAANGHTLHLAIAGSNQGQAEAESTYRTLLADPARVYDDATRHYEHLLANATMLTTPDAVFNTGYRWALVATDRFRATTPGLGTGLLAGYGTGTSGWDGGHAVSGRPGYAWYFGRDAQWACFAVNGYGDFDTVRQQLLLFRDFQDLDGKVFHELSLSGVVHYDAADATPLYVILAAHYVRASGDLDTLRTLWPSLQQALDFLYATDTDGDGFIENTNVGHGWIEGGALFGAHTTLYLAGLWVQALRDAAYLAALLDETHYADRYARDADIVLVRLENEFWNADTGFYHYGKRRDGTFNPEPTVLPAVLMHFGLLDPARVDTMLDAYASNAFSADWGVRILGANSPLFNPKGYHYGSVWPLFTGWAALAEYAYGQSVQGFTHMMSTLLQYRHSALGLVDEVLHGTRYEPSGVCAHQCWSETNILHPLYEGLLGVHPDAPHRTLYLTPRLPVHWDTLRVDNLHVGASRLRFEMTRTATHTTFTFTLVSGPAVTLHFAPEMPQGMTIRAIHVNGEVSPAAQRGPQGLLTPAIEFTLDTETVIGLDHTGGIGVVPYLPQPEPGETSKGLRIIREAMEDRVYAVTVEGPAGTTGRFQVRHFDRFITHMEGATREADSHGEILAWNVSFADGENPYPRRTIRFHTA